MKVFVSGCFDMLHSGHVAFFKEAATYGDLCVGIGSDATIAGLKGRATMLSEQERLYMVKSIRYVSDAWINSGSGLLDFEEDLRKKKVDRYVVNEDGHSPLKEALCRELGIEYLVLKRIPDAGLPARSSTAFRSTNQCGLPYRIDLAGTWIDQPYLSKLHPGWAITISLEPIVEYNERSGMSTSTRNAAKELWPYHLPMDKPEKLAELLFRYENKPGNALVSGAQDAIGICVPGLARHYYCGEYWPEKIEKVSDESVLAWLEDHLYMITLWPRPEALDLMADTRMTVENVQQLAEASAACWEAILKKDLSAFADAFLKSFHAQKTIFPHMVDARIQAIIDRYKTEALAWKLTGAGGGGYLVLVAEKSPENAMKIKIRRWLA